MNERWSFSSPLGTYFWITHSHSQLQIRSGDSAQKIPWENRDRVPPPQRPRLSWRSPLQPAGDLHLPDAGTVRLWEPAFPGNPKCLPSEELKHMLVFLAVGAGNTSKHLLLWSQPYYMLWGTFLNGDFLIFDRRPRAGLRQALYNPGLS